MNKFLKDSSFIFGTQLVNIVSTIIIGIIIARIIGPEGKGIVSLFRISVFAVIIVASLSVETGIAYYVSKNRNCAPVMLNNIILLSVFISLFCIPCLFFIRPYFSKFVFKELPLYYYTIVVLLVPVELLNKYLVGMIQGLELHKGYSILSALISFLSIIFAVLFLVTLSLDIFGGFLIYVASSILLCGVLFLLVYKQIGNFSKKCDVSLLFNTIAFGFKAYFGSITQFMNYRFDVFIVNLFLNFTKVGLYTLAVGIGELIWNIPQALGMTMFAKVTEKSQRHGFEFIAKVCRNSLPVMLLLALVLYFFSGIIIEFIYGKAFLASSTALRIIIPGIIAFGISKILLTGLTACGKPKYVTYNALIVFIIAVSLDLMLIPKFEIAGAAAASTISYVFSSLICINWFCKEANIKIWNVLVINATDLDELRRFILRTKDISSIRS